MVRTNTIEPVNGRHLHSRIGMGNGQDLPSEVHWSHADLLLPCVFFCKTDTCPEDTYRCNYNGQCLLNSLVCDGVKDCPEYGDDEAGCTTHMPPHQQLECRDSFDYIYDRCVLVDPFTATNWDEARYLCEKFSSDLVVLNDYNFYAELLQYIRDRGETQLDEGNHSTSSRKR